MANETFPLSFSGFAFTAAEFGEPQLSPLGTRNRNVLPWQETGLQLDSHNPITLLLNISNGFQIARILESKAALIPVEIFFARSKQGSN